MRLAVLGLAAPDRRGQDRLASLEGPAIFAANHHSHLDTPLLLTSIPEPWRHKILVGAAADYFFGTRLTSALSSLVIGAIPIERSRVSRRSADQAAELASQGWSLLLFPEGGRSPDGWGQPFRGGRRLSGAEVRQACRADPHRGNRSHTAQGQVVAEPLDHVGHVREAAAARTRREHSSVRGADRVRSVSPGRRGLLGLVPGAPAGACWRHTAAHRTVDWGLAQGLVARRPLPTGPQTRQDLAQPLRPQNQVSCDTDFLISYEFASSYGSASTPRSRRK